MSAKKAPQRPPVKKAAAKKAPPREALGGKTEALGGTTMWCHFCSNDRVMRVVPDLEDSAYNFRVLGVIEKDLKFFHRRRVCQVCGNASSTLEVDGKFIEELCRLRDTLEKIKESCESVLKLDQ